MPASALISKTSDAARSRRHEIRERLQTIILSGDQKPGSKLPQHGLAARFGVAQGVVREALLELQAHGLVETVDNRGIFVTGLSAAKILESFDVREMHEALAIRLCCERATRGELRPLQTMALEIYTLGTAEEFDEMARLDREFHSRLLHLSRHSMLIRLAENYRVFGKIIRGNRDPQVVRDEHLAIVEAIAKGAADEAERLIRAHVAAARFVVQKKLESGTSGLQWVK